MIIWGIITLLWGIVGGFDWILDTIQCWNFVEHFPQLLEIKNIVIPVETDDIQNTIISNIDFSSYKKWKESMLFINPDVLQDLSRQAYVDAKYPNLSEWDDIYKAQNELFNSDSE